MNSILKQLPDPGYSKKGVSCFRRLTNTSFELTTLAMILLLSFGCEKKTEDTNKETDFDQAAMLSNIANTVIVPNYESFQEKVIALETAILNFSNASDSLKFITMQAAFKEAYLAWQQVSLFELGPANTQELRSQFNIYPTDTTLIESNISSRSYNLDLLSNKTAKGFPAIDYLLHKSSSGWKAFEQDTTRVNYLKELISIIRSKTDLVVTEWQSTGGNHTKTFSENTGTDVGSSTGELINSLNQYFEKYVRDGKIGIPLGVRSLGIPIPDNVEAFYGGYSIELAIEALQTLEDVFSGGSGSGLDDYLISADAADVADDIKKQLQAAKSKLSQLNDPLSETIENEKVSVEAAYSELQKLIVLLKVDMPSRLGVLITYQDTDGD